MRLTFQKPIADDHKHNCLRQPLLDTTRLIESETCHDRPHGCLHTCSTLSWSCTRTQRSLNTSTRETSTRPSCLRQAQTSSKHHSQPTKPHAGPHTPSPNILQPLTVLLLPGVISRTLRDDCYPQTPPKRMVMPSYCRREA
jgi:hypothetical protein